MRCVEASLLVGSSYDRVGSVVAVPRQGAGAWGKHVKCCICLQGCTAVGRLSPSSVITVLNPIFPVDSLLHLRCHFKLAKISVSPLKHATQQMR